MTNQKRLKRENTSPNQSRPLKEGEDVPFGPPPEEFSYRCSHCKHEMKVNEAIIDVEIAKAVFEGACYEEFMPILGCPNCNREAMEYAED